MSANYELLSEFCSEFGTEFQVELSARFQCAGCGEWNEIFVDSSAGSKQSYIEDCQTCCKPNLLVATWDMGAGEYSISAQLEY